MKSCRGETADRFGRRDGIFIILVPTPGGKQGNWVLAGIWPTSRAGYFQWFGCPQTKMGCFDLPVGLG